MLSTNMLQAHCPGFQAPSCGYLELGQRRRLELVAQLAASGGGLLAPSHSHADGHAPFLQHRHEPTHSLLAGSLKLFRIGGVLKGLLGMGRQFVGGWVWGKGGGGEGPPEGSPSDAL